MIHPDVLKNDATTAIDNLLKWQKAGNEKINKAELSAKIIKIGILILGAILVGAAITSAITFTATPILTGTAVSVLSLCVMFSVHEFVTCMGIMRAISKWNLEKIKKEVFATDCVDLSSVNFEIIKGFFKTELQRIEKYLSPNETSFKKQDLVLFHGNMPPEQILKAYKTTALALNLLSAIRFIKHSCPNQGKVYLSSVKTNVEASDLSPLAKEQCNKVVQYLETATNIPEKLSGVKINLEVFEIIQGFALREKLFATRDGQKV
jgi:hypothetical protein